MRHTLMALASALLLAACGSDSGSPMETTLSRTTAEVAGTYDLTKVNSDPLPYTHHSDGIIIEDGALTLTEEGAFAYSVTRTYPEGEGRERVTVDYAGSYEVRGAELHLIHASSGWRQVATFAQGGVIVPSDPYWLLFVRP